MQITAAVALLIFGTVAASASQFEAFVTPLRGEDIASECHYELTIPTANHEIRAVWVIFDRARDVHDLYTDPTLLAFARRYDIALLLHGHCPGNRPEDHMDMNMEPSEGLGPALLRALDQFARQTEHGELRTAKIILLGFSGAGSLCARLVGFLPDRTLAAILSAPGHYEPVGIDTVKLDARALTVPELIIAGGADNVSGTARPYQYFREYRQQGAPWAFIVQNGSPHCCTANATTLVLTWLEAVMKGRCPCALENHPRTLDQSRGWLTTLVTRETGIRDSFGMMTFNASTAAIQQVDHRHPQTPNDAGWLPDRATAQLWLAFVKQQKHPILSLN